MTQKEKEVQQKVAEALALIVTAQGRDNYTSAAADHASRLSE